MKKNTFKLFLLIFVSLVWATESADYDGCYNDDPIQIEVFKAKFGDNATMTPTSCCSECLKMSYMYCAISEAIICSCSNTLPPSSTLCSALCNDGSSECGDLDNPAIFSVYLSGYGDPSIFNLAIDAASFPWLVISFTFGPSLELFQINFGDGAPNIIVTNAVRTPLAPNGFSITTTYYPGYALGGSYTITVIGYIPNTPLSASSTLLPPVVKDNVASIDLLSCPQIEYPDIPYECDIAVSYKNDAHQYKVSFDDVINSPVETIISNVGNVFKPLGNIVPKGKSTEVGGGSAVLETVIMINHPVRVASKLIFVEFLTYEAGHIEVMIYRPSCSSGEDYCVLIGRCLPTGDCPYNSDDIAITCIGDALCHSCDKCSSYTQIGTAPTYAAIVIEDFGTNDHTPNYGEQIDFPTPLNLLPGDVLAVKGSIAYSSNTKTPGDLVDNVETDRHHYARMIVQEIIPLKIKFQCSNVLNNVTMSVTDLATVDPTIYAGTFPQTICERNITDLEIDINQTDVEAFDPTLNIESPYYVWAGYPFSVMNIFSTAGPITFDYAFTPVVTSVTSPVPLLQDFNKTDQLYAEEVIQTISSDGFYVLKVDGYNQHNTLPHPDTGIVSGPLIREVDIYSLFPVSPLWGLTLDPSAVANSFIVPIQDPTFVLTDANAWSFPTNATITIDWGDGSVIEELLFLDPGNQQPQYIHLYTEGGVYTINANISNLVSGMSIVPVQFTIYEEILNFFIETKYFPSESGPPKSGFGRLNNKFPIDKNITFYPGMSYGTVESYELTYTVGGANILTITVPDPFQPIVDFLYHHHLTIEAKLNLTVTAVNVHQRVEVLLFVETVAYVVGIFIDDESLVTSAEESKMFKVTFESKGVRTCLVLDLGDQSDYLSYGDEAMCKQKFSHAIYDGSVLLSEEMIFSHVYSLNGMYNITAIAYNHVSKVDFMIMFPVTDIDCAPPKVNINGQVKDHYSAPLYYKGDQIVISAIATLNCADVTSTKKRWQIFTVDEVTGSRLQPVFVMHIIPSWDKPEFVIPPAFLTYGYHSVLYTVTMWDNEKLDPNWPFQRITEHYIYIEKTPIVAKMTASGATSAKIGFDQPVHFEPAIHSFDPDWPDDKSFTITWRCKAVGEDYTDGDTTLYPMTLGALGTGCFGNGPGYLDNPNSISITGGDFIGAGKFEIEAIVTKDTRSDPVTMLLEIVQGPVPFLHLECASKMLCVPNESGIGVSVNSNVRMGMSVNCLLACEDLGYVWAVTDLDGNAISVDASDIPLGSTSEHFTLSESFYAKHPNVKQFKLTVKATNADGQIGESSYIMKVNQRPIGGDCTIDKYRGRVLVDIFYLECFQWIDPENKGIKHYTIKIVVDGKTPKTLMQQSHTSFAIQKMELVLPIGEFELQVEISDVMDATYVFKFDVNLIVDAITLEELIAYESDQKIDILLGGGDVNMLTMAVNARNSILNELDVNDENLTKEEKEDLLFFINKANAHSVEVLEESLNMKSRGSAEATVGVLADIIVTSTKTPDNTLALDTFTINKTVKMLEVPDLPSSAPEDLLKLMEYVAALACAITVVSFNDLRPNIVSFNDLRSIIENINDLRSSTRMQEISDPSCKRVGAYDLMVNADKMDYDTRITSVDMEVNTNIDISKMCNIRDTAMTEGASQMDRLDKIMKKLSRYVLEKQLPGEVLEVTTENNMTVSSALLIGGIGLAGRHYCGKSYIEFPEKLCPQGECSEPVGLSLREWPTITFIASKSASMLTGGSRVLDVEVYDKFSNLLKVLSNVGSINVSLYRTLQKRDNNIPPDAQLVTATYETKYQQIPIMYTKFQNNQTGAGITIEIEPLTSNHDKLFLMVMRGRLPTLGSFDVYTLVKDIPNKIGNHYEYFISSKKINGMGNVFIGIGEYQSTFSNTQISDPVKYNATLKWLRKPMTINYKLRVFTSGCFSYAPLLKNWTSADIEVTMTHSVSSSVSTTICKTDHVASFSSGMFCMPNTIDFSYVFANMGFSDNLTIYITLILCGTLFILLLIWGRHEDKKDIKMLGAAPLPDNLVNDKYLYEILVFTGNKKEAQTDSTVQFILSGDYGDSEVRTFGDDERKIFRKASADVFVMATPKSLGPLSYIRIWHDNTGRGPNASWYLSYIVFRDVQTGQKYEFICNEWFAVESHDAQIERLIGVAGKEEKGDFGHLFHNTSNKSLVDGHLWFSVFMRPPRSRFTRCQRVACCFALLFLSMLVNAMWYDRVPSQPASGGLNIGPFSLSTEQLGVGLLSNLIVFPPSLLIVFLFRKAAPKVLRKSRIQEALARASKNEMKKKHGDNWEEHYQRQQKEERDLKEQKEKEESEKLDNEDKKKKKKKKFVLPYWCQYIAWLLVVLCIAASVFFLMMYGVMFGNEKATKWVTALIISFFSSVLFVQPIKIFVTAIFMSMICKSTDLDEDDADEDEEKPQLDHDELWLYNGKRSSRLGGRVDKSMLEELREKRLKEVEMWQIIVELAVYCFFIWILLVLSYGQRDPSGWYLQNSLKKTFIREGYIDHTDYTKVAHTDLFWYYLHNAFMPELRADRWYNGKPPYQLRGFLNDYNNRMMGYATIRQIRVKKNSCAIAGQMVNVTNHCASYTNLVNEEGRDYCTNWEVPNTRTRNTPACQAPEYKFSTASELQTLPIWGQRGSYSGAGYVIHLSGPSEDILERFTYLQKNKWIDRMTRAIIIDFATYNAHVNLFGICTIMAEFTPGGGITPSYRFDAISLIAHQDNFGGFVIVCEILFIIFVVYFTLHEFRLMYKSWRKYFASYWAFAELSLIAVSYSAIALYVLRYFETKKALKTFNETNGNGYVKLNYAASLDEFYGYAVGFLVFVGTLKFIKLLRFNKRMGVLSSTLSKCWDDLQGFLMAFLICFSSFVLMFYLLLHPYIYGFSNFVSALETSFSMMMGKFQFNEMKDVNPVVPVMFFVFVLCTSWVLINLLLTLIIKAFEEVKNDLMSQPNEYEMIDFVFTKFKKLLGRSAVMNNTKKKPNAPETRCRFDDQPDNADVQNLPSKVDKFLEYVNMTYFDGQMDLSKKQDFGTYQESGHTFLTKRKILGIDDDE